MDTSEPVTITTTTWLDRDGERIAYAECAVTSDGEWNGHGMFVSLMTEKAGAASLLVGYVGGTPMESATFNCANESLGRSGFDSLVERIPAEFFEVYDSLRGRFYMGKPLAADLSNLFFWRK